MFTIIQQKKTIIKKMSIKLMKQLFVLTIWWMFVYSSSVADSLATEKGILVVIK